MEKHFKSWLSFDKKKNLTGKDALKAVESDGDALRYVKDQNEAICLKAVESNGDALQYVEEDIFYKNKIKVTANGKVVFISEESAESLGLV